MSSGGVTFHDPHCVRLCPSRPDRLYQQNHCGIYRPHVRFFVNGEAVSGLSQPLRPKDAIVIVPALSGG